MKRSPGLFWVILIALILLTPSGILSKPVQFLEPAQQRKESINPHGKGMGPDSIAPSRFLEDDPPPFNYFSRSGPTGARKFPGPVVHQSARFQEEAAKKQAPRNPPLTSRIAKLQIPFVENQGQIGDPSEMLFSLVIHNRAISLPRMAAGVSRQIALYHREGYKPGWRH